MTPTKPEDALVEQIRDLRTRATPGPWRDQLHHEKRDGGRFHAFVTADGVVPVACVPTGVEGYGREEGRANVQLIALVPQMADAITTLLERERRVLGLLREAKRFVDENEGDWDSDIGPRVSAALTGEATQDGP